MLISINLVDAPDKYRALVEISFGKMLKCFATIITFIFIHYNETNLKLLFVKR